MSSLKPTGDVWIALKIESSIGESKDRGGVTPHILTKRRSARPASSLLSLTRQPSLKHALIMRASGESIPSEKRKISGCVKIFSQGLGGAYKRAHHQRENVIESRHGIGIVQELE